MLGAIIGDIIGSSKEQFTKGTGLKKQRFTDDTVLSVATAYQIMNPEISYAETYQMFYRLYKDRGFGETFKVWAESIELKPYNSFGNGAAMRVAPVAYSVNTIEEVLAEAKRSSEVTHSHLDGINGAQAIALATFLARQGQSKAEIKRELSTRFSYNLSISYQDLGINPAKCPESIINALICFFDSSNFLDAINKATALGGDTDTVASMAGAIAEAFYKPNLEEEFKNILLTVDDYLINIVNDFRVLYPF